MDLDISSQDCSTTKRLVSLSIPAMGNLLKQMNDVADCYETVAFLQTNSNKQESGGLRTRGLYKQNNVDVPLISIVTIVFNGEAFLEQTILSVLHQKYDNVEYIVIDGGSTDGTLDIIKKYEDAIDYWVSEPDDGISDAFNKGVRLCFGNYIGILNADDYYIDNNVLSSVANYTDNSKKQLIYGKTKKLTPNDELLIKNDNKRSWCMSIPFSHCSSFLSRSIYKEIGVFSSKYKIAMDVDLLLRAKQVCELQPMDVFIGVQRDGGISDKQRFNGYKEYLRLSYPQCGLKAYVFYYLKILIALRAKLFK